MSFASQTTVSVEKTRAEIDRLLGKHGAGHRGIMVDEGKNLAQIAFVIHSRRYRLDVPMPKNVGVQRQYDQACRTRWRTILLTLKAKFELVDLGISSIEKEFLGDMILQNGQSLHLAVAEAIRTGLASGEAPVLALPQGEGR